MQQTSIGTHLAIKMKTEIIFLTIERWHCIDLVLDNIALANKPKDIQVLCVISGSDKYFNHIKNAMMELFGDRARFVRNEEEGIEHDKLREDRLKNKGYPMGKEKADKIYRAYSLVKDNLDKTADYYWFIEDDTLFPLDVYDRYTKLMDALNADVITGISYYWHFPVRTTRNFWRIKENKTFPEGDSSSESRLVLEPMEHQDKGIAKLGGSGLGNVLAKRDAVLSWQPKSFKHLRSGADISFYYNAMKNGFDAYGDWSISLPHITKHIGGGVEIFGKVDRELWNKLVIDK